MQGQISAKTSLFSGFGSKKFLWGWKQQAAQTTAGVRGRLQGPFSQRSGVFALRAKMRDEDEPIRGRSGSQKSPTASLERRSQGPLEEPEKTEFVIKGAEDSDSGLTKEEELEEFIQVLGCFQDLTDFEREVIIERFRLQQEDESEKTKEDKYYEKTITQYFSDATLTSSTVNGTPSFTEPMQELAKKLKQDEQALKDRESRKAMARRVAKVRQEMVGKGEIAGELEVEVGAADRVKDVKKEVGSEKGPQKDQEGVVNEQKKPQVQKSTENLKKKDEDKDNEDKKESNGIKNKKEVEKDASDDENDSIGMTDETMSKVFQSNQVAKYINFLEKEFEL